MIYLFWAILNIGLFIFFIVLCFKATSLLRQKFGLFVSIFFVFALLSFMCNTNDNTHNKIENGKIRTWEFTSRDSLDKEIFHTKLNLKKHLLSKSQLGILYGKTKQGNKYVPISAHSNTIGFISGTSWIPNSIMVIPTKDSLKFEYSVNATTLWNLLGVTVFSQTRDYEGIINIK